MSLSDDADPATNSMSSTCAEVQPSAIGIQTPTTPADDVRFLPTAVEILEAGRRFEPESLGSRSLSSYAATTSVLGGGGEMRTNYVLIDFENVQPKDVALLHGHAFKVLVFAGANQKKIPLDLVKTLQPMGGDADYIPISGNGKNALDFHIACYLGELANKDPDGFYHVISKDAGFDPLIAHLKTRGIYAQRSSAIGEIPILGFIAPKTIDERVDAVIKNLESRGNARPRRVKTLASTIHALFLKKLEQSEVDGLVAALQQRGKIVATDGKVTYTF